MDRESVLASVEANVENEALIRHMLATEAVMRALAQRLEEDGEEWGLTGLLHNIDVELTADEPHSRSALGADIARELGASEEMAQAIHCHNETHGVECETMLAQALFCADPLADIITTAALSRPDMKLSELTIDCLKERFPAAEKRDRITLCHRIGLELEEFMGIGLDAIQRIEGELDLRPNG